MGWGFLLGRGRRMRRKELEDIESLEYTVEEIYVTALHIALLRHCAESPRG